HTLVVKVIVCILRLQLASLEQLRRDAPDGHGGPTVGFLGEVVSQVTQRGPVVLHLSSFKQVEQLLFRCGEQIGITVEEGELSLGHNGAQLCLVERGAAQQSQFRVGELYQILGCFKDPGPAVTAGGGAVDHTIHVDDSTAQQIVGGGLQL